MNLNVAFPAGYIAAEDFALGYSYNQSVQLAPLPVPANSITLADIKRAKEAMLAVYQKQPECCNQREKPMRTNNEVKNYFADRAEEVFYTNDKSLQVQFGLVDDKAPRTAAELVARIQAGKFVLPAKKDQDYGPQSITWRDPSIVKDHDGYAVAYKALQAERTSTIDQIMSDETKALGAVDAFQAWTYTAPVATVTA